MEDDPSATFWEHLEELRQTLIRILVIVFIGFLASFVFSDQLLTWLTQPLTAISDQRLVILGPVEGFGTAVKVSFWFGLTATSPVWCLYLLRFVAPALRQQERRLVFPFLLASALFIGAGMLFAFWVTIPLANAYLFAFNTGIGANLWSLSSYMDYTVLLLLANGLAFEFAVVFIFLIHYGWLSAEWLRQKQRLMIVLIFVMSAVLTPPDVLTQVLLAVPLVAIYEALIWYARLRETVKARTQI